MKKLIALCASLLVTLSSQATLLTIELDNTNYQVGDQMQANIIVSDIEQEFGFQKLLSTFDFDLLFDNSIVTYQSTTFGSLLDVDPFLASDQFTSDSGTGELTVSEISFAFSDDLFAAQDGVSSFILASVNFDVVASGTSLLELSNVNLADDFGTAFGQVSILPTEFTVAGVTSVPEMPSVMIFALGLLGFMARKAAVKS